MNPKSPATDKDIAVRLRRIEGQIRGIERMLEEDRACEQTLTQLMAVRAGIDQVGLLMMENPHREVPPPGPQADPERLEELRETLKMWARFGLLPGAASPLD